MILERNQTECKALNDLLRENSGILEYNITGLRNARYDVSELCTSGPNYKNFKPALTDRESVNSTLINGIIKR